MDWDSPHDGSTAAASTAPGRLTAALLHDAAEHAPFAGVECDSSEVTLWRPAPGVQVAVPAHYTPTYAYPLIVWLCEEGTSEWTVDGWLDRISPRNYIAVGLRRELYWRSRRSGDPGGPGCQARIGLSRFASTLRRIASELRVHPDRRYVAGAGSAGRVAIEWLLRRPDWFAGGIVIDVDQPSAAAWRMLTPGLCRQRLLWVETGLTSGEALGHPDPTALRCLGLRVEEWRPLAHVDWPVVAARMDDWIMADIPTAVVR